MVQKIYFLRAYATLNPPPPPLFPLCTQSYAFGLTPPIPLCAYVLCGWPLKTETGRNYPELEKSKIQLTITFLGITSFKSVGIPTSVPDSQLEEGLCKIVDKAGIFFSFPSGFSFTDTDNSRTAGKGRRPPAHVYSDICNFACEIKITYF